MLDNLLLAVLHKYPVHRPSNSPKIGGSRLRQVRGMGKVEMTTFIKNDNNK